MTTSIALPRPREAHVPDPDLVRQTPYLQLDLTTALGRFRRLSAALPETDVHYAVKANPHPELLAALVRAGCRFDVASPAEVRLRELHRGGLARGKGVGELGRGTAREVAVAHQASSPRMRGTENRCSSTSGAPESASSAVRPGVTTSSRNTLLNGSAC